MLAHERHEIMQKRLDIWQAKKLKKTPNIKKVPVTSDTSWSGRKGCKLSTALVETTPRIRKSPRHQHVKDAIATTNDNQYMSKKLEVWLNKKRVRIEYERAKEICPWNSTVRKPPVSRLYPLKQFEENKGIPGEELRRVKIPVQVTLKCENTSSQKKSLLIDGACLPAQTPRRRVLKSVPGGPNKLNVSPSNNTDSVSREGMRTPPEAWPVAKDKTPHCVRRSVRGETFEGVKLTPGVIDDDAVSQMEEQDEEEQREVAAMMTTIDECLQSCLDYINQVKGQTLVGGWLEELLDRCSGVTGRALYWVCQARVAEIAGQGQDHILALYDKAVDNQAKPTDILKSALQDFVCRHLTNKDTSPCKTPVQVTQCPATPGLSSTGHLPYWDTPRPDTSACILRYSVVDAAPILDQFQDGSSGQSFLVTPVRRSVRIQKRITHVPGADHCIASLQELPLNMDCLVMRPNRALEKEFMCSLDE